MRVSASEQLWTLVDRVYQPVGVIVCCNRESQRVNIARLPTQWRTPSVLLHDGKSRATAPAMLLRDVAPHVFGAAMRFERSPDSAGTVCQRVEVEGLELPPDNPVSCRAHRALLAS